MYARLHFFCSLVVGFMLCLGLGQEASAQCATMISRLGQMPTDGLRLQVGNYGPNVQFRIGTTITPLNSAINPSPPGLSPDWTQNTYQSSTGCTNAVPSGGSNNAHAGWPAAPHPSANGLYKFTFTGHQVGSSTVVPLFTFNAYSLGGQWTTQPPPSPPPPIPPNGVTDPYNPANPTQGILSIYVSKESVPVSNAAISISGSGSVLSSTDPNGRAAFYLPPGGWLMSITAFSTTVQRSVQMPSAGNISLSVNFDANNNPTWSGGGDDPSTGGNSGSGGWLADIMRTLFVPQQSNIDALKVSLSGLYTWGPFNLATQLMGFSSVAPTAMLSLSMPVPQYNPSCGCYNAVAGYVPVTDGGLTQVPLWATLRMLMGASVWISFAIYIAKSLMPVTTV